jgi:cysteine desulfurase family protein
LEYTPFETRDKHKKMIYLDNAATTYPKPETVYKRVDEILRTVGGNPGRSSHRMALEAGRVIFSARESLGRLLGVPDASRIAFTKNATEAVNVALKGLIKPGDHVVTTSFEHNSVARTLYGLEKQGVAITKLKGKRADLIGPRDVEDELTTETKMVCMVHASNVFGTLQPVDEISEVCRKRGVLLMLDGAQTVGAVAFDVNADIIAGTGHKALFGPQGTGFIYLREGIEPPPLVDGGTGELTDILEIPDRLETGTINTPGIGGLGEGVGFVLDEGVEKIRAREVGLLSLLIEGLKEISGVNILGTLDPAQRVGLVSFTLDGLNPEETGVRLDREFSIMVRSGTHCAPDAHVAAGTHPDGAIRVSPGYFNTQEEIEQFLGAIKTITGERS